MWVLKVKGETHYVTHVTVEPGVGFSTKETPDNPHTKGSIKLKGNLEVFKNSNDQLEARIYGTEQHNKRPGVEAKEPQV